MDLLSGRRSGGERAATARVRAWVRELTDADDHLTVVVSELACSDPGCPDVETVIAVGSAGEAPVRFALKKPARRVARSELEAIFLRPDPEGAPTP